MGEWLLKGGQCLIDGQVRAQDLVLSGGVTYESTGSGGQVFDASGLVIAPGIVDLHGDGFERNMSPRPGVYFTLETALVETDRQLIANGITTAYLAMTISFEPGLRSLDQAQKLVAALGRVRPMLMTDIRLQLRWETYALDAVDQVEAWLDMDPQPMLAFNDHYSDMLGTSREVKKIPEYAARAGVTPAEYRDLVTSYAARADEVPIAMARLADAAKARGVPMLSHDEKSPEVRARHRALGVGISEFPLNRETASDAVAAGEPTVLGAPNVLRGGSHLGAVDAEPAVRDGLCKILASDYFYPAQMQAVMRMAGGDLDALATHWPLISENPSRCMDPMGPVGLRPGARADVLCLDVQGPVPRVAAVFRNGQMVQDNRVRAG